MKYLTILFSIILFGCQNQQSQFIGSWYCDDFGGFEHTVTITEGENDNQIIIYGTASADQENNHFESIPYNGGVISTGTITSSGLMEYCQKLQGSEVCGEFYKIE